MPAGAATHRRQAPTEGNKSVFLLTQGSALGRVLVTRAPYIATPYALGMTSGAALLPVSLAVAEIDKVTGDPQLTDPVRTGFATGYGGIVDLLYTTAYPTVGEGANQVFDAIDANASAAAPVLDPLARPFSDGLDTFGAAATATSEGLGSVGLDVGSPEALVNYGVYVLKFGTGAPD